MKTLSEHEKDQVYLNYLKTNPLKPCVYLDNGGMRRMSHSLYANAELAKKDWADRFIYWPETNPYFYENLENQQ